MSEPAPSPRDLVVSPYGAARCRGRQLPCALGRGGVHPDKTEGDGRTLAGRFRLEFLYVRKDRLGPSRRLPFYPLAAERRTGLTHGWCDASADPAYNQPAPWPYAESAERLWRADPLYDVIGVIDANRNPVRAGAGSALFLHVWRAPRYPTAGCIAFRRGDLLWILSGWRPRDRVIVRD